MCGIGAIVNLAPGVAPPAREALLAMLGALDHRGPDEHGLYRDARAGLAHARLSIIDLSTGQQPLCNEDGTLWIVFNGEIFNYVELRSELIALGHTFRTQSDTEVIVHAWEAWGEAAFERMNGQWAVALWDAARHRLVLSRDRVGVRPLYLSERNGTLYLASEVKALFAAEPALRRGFDPLGLLQTFTFWASVAPRAVFAGVEELRPGYVRVYADGRFSERPYWQPQYPLAAARRAARSASIEQSTAAVRDTLEQAARLRMVRADVPVGSYLSGGIDSSLIAALGNRYSSGRLQTFSLGFEDPEYDETRYQQLMVRALGSEHHELRVTRRDIARVFPEVVYHAERPLLRTAAAPMFLLSRLVRERGIKVVLTGEGADEMFAGYDLFREGKVRRFWARQPDSRMRPRLLDRLYPYLLRSPVAQRAMAVRFFGRGLDSHAQPGFAHQMRWQTTAALTRLFAPELRQAAAAHDVVRELLADLPAAMPQWSGQAQDQCIEVRTLLSGYLLSSQGDRMLMANSVEGRFPFLDKDVIALADGLPDDHKLRVLDEKHVVKRAARGLVPDEILERTKQPYRAPDAESFVADGVPDYAAELLEPRALAAAGVFDPAQVSQLWNKCRRQADGKPFSNADNMALVGVLSTQLVHDRLLARAAPGARALALAVDADTLTMSSGTAPAFGRGA
jgi:asparagine synthase (glutamine-hydrolysing)